MAITQSRIGLSHVTVVPTNYDPEADEVVDADEESDTTSNGRKFT